jgi:hypothetical protein
MVMLLNLEESLPSCMNVEPPRLANAKGFPEKFDHIAPDSVFVDGPSTISRMIARFRISLCSLSIGRPMRCL